MIEINRIKCLTCKEILESKSRHDFQKCGCKNSTFTDGGHDYQRIGAVDMTKVGVWDEKTKKYKKLQDTLIKPKKRKV